jgi:hypothetical protein
MKKLLFLLILAPVLCFSQSYYKQPIFFSADTIGSITSSDTVEVRFHNGPWKLLTSSVNDTALITGDDKIAEGTVIFNMASETWWTYTSQMQIRIYSTGVDTVTSYPVLTSGLNGAVTLFIIPDTSGTNTRYYNSFIEGK